MNAAKRDRRPKADSRASGNPAARPKALAKFVDDGGIHTHPVYSFALADRASKAEYGWDLRDDSMFEAFRFMADVASTSWGELRQQMTVGRQKHHEHRIGDLPPQARARLESLQLDDIGDSIFRFRTDGEGRLWGFAVGGVFYVVWWDPQHKEYPTEKSHT